MKRFSFSDSSSTLLYQHKEALKGNLVYNKGEFVAMLDRLEYEENMELEEMNVKKKRLSVEQVKALEKVFESDRQLDPDRKVKIAQEIGLEPKQVAIWFQNRRARQKTKQLERDYNLLKANYEALQLNYTRVEQEKQGLIAELKGLKEKIGEENAGLHHSAKEPTIILGSSDSDSSGDCSLNIVQLMHKISSSVQRSDFAHVEEDSCNIFSVDQAPELYWYCSEQRN